MTPRRQRQYFVAFVLCSVGLATFLALRALEGNLLYFFSPSQVLAGEAPTRQNFRLGGLVVAGSVMRETDGLTVRFDLTDTAARMTVRFKGILPDLFREGQGIVAMGSLDDRGIFVAEEVLAKHDENYMPPEVADALAKIKDGTRVEAPHEYKR